MAVAIPSPLPRLRRLILTTGDAAPAQMVKRLVGTAQHLTFLRLQRLEQDHLDGLQQLGAVPVLQELHLNGCIPSLVPASDWLQQQPQLITLEIQSYHQIGHGPPPQLGQLPPRLETLRIGGCWSVGAAPSGSLSEALVSLTGLRVLMVHSNRPRHDEPPGRLPSGLSRLTRLEQLQWGGHMEGWEVLAELPLLQMALGGGDIAAVLSSAAPHLCYC
jgi:hypothetical protein